MENPLASEKVSVNLSVGDLARVDLLVESGSFTNRSDFIQSAVRQALVARKGDIEAAILEQKKAKGTEITVGILSLPLAYFKKLLAKNEKVSLCVYGLLVLPADLSLDLMKKTMSSVKVRGLTSSSKEIKQFYGLK
jgi:Arc/MetJ-type ribon-helix-helix transcriptional regulator